MSVRITRMYQNIASSILRFIAIIFAVVFLVFGVFAIVECVKYKDYVTFEADVTAAYNAPSSTETTEHYIDISYTYNGTEYKTTQQVITDYKVGDKIKIRLNPDKPDQLAGNIKMLVFIILAGVFGLISLIMGLVAFFIRKVKTA